MSRLSRSIFAFISLLLSAAPPALLGDTVRLVGGEEVRGEIRKETVSGLVIQSGAAARSLSRQQIAPDGVTHENLPQALREAREALTSRNFGDAHLKFRTVIALCEAATAPVEAKQAGQKADPKKKSAPAQRASAAAVRPIFHQHALYGEVKTFEAEGNDAETVRAIDALLQKFGDSWYLLDVLLLKVRLLSARDDAAALDGAVEDAKGRAAKAGAGAEVADRIEIIRGETLLKRGKTPEALKAFHQVEKSPVRPVSDAAKLGIAQIGLAGGENQGLVDAKMVFQGLIRDAKDRAVLCGAARGLGDCQMREMKDAKTVDGLREALETYLRAAVLYFPAEGDPTEPHQEALLKAAQCAQELSALLKRDTKSKDTRAQEGFAVVARELLRELTNTYPGTPLARQAEGMRAK